MHLLALSAEKKEVRFIIRNSVKNSMLFYNFKNRNKVRTV